MYIKTIKNCKKYYNNDIFQIYVDNSCLFLAGMLCANTTTLPVTAVVVKGAEPRKHIQYIYNVYVY